MPNRTLSRRSALIVSALAALSALAAAGCNNPPTPSSGGPVAGASPAPAASGAGGGDLTIAVIPKGTTHSFWKAVEAGAQEAGKELGVKIVWKGPLKENDRAQQIGIVQQFVSDKVSGIVLAPLDDTALVKPVQSAAQAKIPVVIFDSALKGEQGKDFASFVATDNRKGGQLGGERLAKLLGGKGKVVLLRYQVGSASTMEREAGFLEAIQKNPGIELIVDNRYAGATVGEAKNAAMNLVDKLKQADGVFCPNESSTAGMLLALRQNGLAGKVKFVGFDSSESLLDGLNKGEINALVVQNPKKMGYEGVKTLVSVIKGEEVPASVDTGVAVVDKENLGTPDIKALVGG
jgi:ribose transport system substrate-binding protein